jgi:hypothetical protein
LSAVLYHERPADANVFAREEIRKGEKDALCTDFAIKQEAAIQMLQAAA